MEILLIFFLLSILFLILFVIFKMVKWIFQKQLRIKWVFIAIGILILGIVTKKMFFTNMEFIQSKVYSNLYIVKNPVKDNDDRNKAITTKIEEHLKSKHQQTKELSYSETKSIYFYEYVGVSFSFLSESGTQYFIDHEEDLGGFVSEELGMYQEYRMAEFYYKPCTKDTTLLCGELDLYTEGEFVKTDTLINLNK